MREKIAARLNYWDKLTRATVEINEKDSWLITSLAEKSKWLQKADQILAIEGLHEEAENQDLPECPYGRSEMVSGWKAAQQDMLKDNWVKVKRRETFNK